MDVLKVVILNVNYIKVCFESVYDVFFIGRYGYLVYEFIIDLCFYKFVVFVEDVVKCLIDYGFYVFILFWLVFGMIMIEFIESESKDEFDCFCDVMFCIWEEIDEIVWGEVVEDNNVLVNVLYVLQLIIMDDWYLFYFWFKVAFLLFYLCFEYKFWVSVGCVDNVFGDCNLVCICLLMEVYEEDVLSQD